MSLERSLKRGMESSACNGECRQMSEPCGFSASPSRLSFSACERRNRKKRNIGSSACRSCAVSVGSLVLPERDQCLQRGSMEITFGLKVASR